MIVGLIPARSGSKRVPNKNLRLLAGKSLVYWAVGSALESGVFDDIVVSSDNDDILRAFARTEGVRLLRRPADIAGDTSTDFEWVTHATSATLATEFAILRPTNPFRTADTIRRAYKQFCEDPMCDSLRAVQPCREHPHKMWMLEGNKLWPLDDWPWGADLPYQSLPSMYVQNGCIQIAHTKLLERRTITGDEVRPFLTEGYEGFDINTPEDLILAEALIEKELVSLG
jgi:N-acylneuraminate cytidylyltransferase